jgi:integrase
VNAYATAAAPASDGDGWPADDLLVLRSRLSPGTSTGPHSRFGDDQWDLSAARPDVHRTRSLIHWESFPAQFTMPAKMIVLAMLDHPCPADMFAGAAGLNLAIDTINARARSIRILCEWLADRGIGSLDRAGDRELDGYLAYVRALSVSATRKNELLAAVSTIFGFREHVPPPCRLATQAPWDGAAAHELVRTGRALRENSTPRIDAATMEALLGWSLRTIEELAPDIIAAWNTYRQLRAGTHASQQRYAGLPFSRRLGAYLDSLTETGQQLPGLTRQDGTITPNWNHVARLVGMPGSKVPDDIKEHARSIGTQPGAVIGCASATTGTRPWRLAPITAEEIRQLVRHLVTACFVVISYLSGMRPGEVLNLRRGCRIRDENASTLLVCGLRGKGRGRTKDGSARTWVVVTPVHAAIAVLEQLSAHDLLFPATIVLDRTAVREPKISARTTVRVGEDIECFTAWVNQTFTGGTALPIPPDPAGQIQPRRFRRTLAYFIVRQPRGLIATALQYGHVSTRVTMSYAGICDTSWTNDLAVERLELIIDQADGDWSLLQAHEHVSGASAAEYRARVQRAARFAGRVVSNARSAERLLGTADPAIYHGEAMTCVWRAETAACRTARIEAGLPLNSTPEESECRPGCRNLAYTDRDIDQISIQAAALRQRAGDPLAPRPIRDRAAARTARLQEIIDRHEATRPAGTQPGRADLMSRTPRQRNEDHSGR